MRTRTHAFVVALCLALSVAIPNVAHGHEWREVRSRYVDKHKAEERRVCDRHAHGCEGDAPWRHLVRKARRVFRERSRWLRANKTKFFFAHHGSVKAAIAYAFPDHAEQKAEAVAHCESELNVYAVSSSGKYKGLYQMGPDERERFGFAWNKWTQARGAYHYWKISGWSPWPVCGD